MAVDVTIWHNPRCSKSRQTLELLQSNGVEPTVRLYATDAPDAAAIRSALEKLGLAARDIIRTGDPEFQTAGLGPESSEEELIAAMVRFPKLIERPIVFANGSARIGRPPEAVLEIL